MNRCANLVAMVARTHMNRTIWQNKGAFWDVKLIQHIAHKTNMAVFAFMRGADKGELLVC